MERKYEDAMKALHKIILEMSKQEIESLKVKIADIGEKDNEKA